MVAAGKKLLVLDINGLLIDTYFQAEQRPDRAHDAKVNRFYVYKRTGCEEFVKFCLENFVVGVWSSARQHNVFSLVEYMFKEYKSKLAFIWHQMHCTDTNLKHPDNHHKPVFLKELSKLWDKSEPDLPWEKGDFGPSNTILIDDSPYKALRNPPHTGIFPDTYKATDPEDNYLVGALRKYLEGLVGTADVRVYIEKNPFGVPRLGHGDQHYQFFSAVMDTAEIVDPPRPPSASPKPEEKVVAVTNTVGDTVVALPDSDVFASSHRRRGKRRFGSTAEESLEHSATDVQSPRDFAERLSRAVDASQNLECERDALGGSSPPVADGVLGRPPRRGDSQTYNPRDGRSGRDRSCGRQPSHRDGQVRTQSQRRDLGDARIRQNYPSAGRRTSVVAVDGQWSKGGLDFEQNHNQRSVSGNQWFSRGLDPQQPYRGRLGVIGSAIRSKWGGTGERQGPECEWDSPDVGIRHRVPTANHPLRLSSERPVPLYVDSKSRSRVQAGANKQLEDNIRRGQSRDSRSSHRGPSPHKGRSRDREVLQRDKFMDRGRPREREPVYRELLRDPEFPLRARPRSVETPYSREYDAVRRVGAREHEDFDRSYARPPFPHHEGSNRGRPRDSVNDKNPQIFDPEKGRGRSRHREGLDRRYSRPSQVYNGGVEGVSKDIPYGDYDEYRHSKTSGPYDERSEDYYARSSSKNWRGSEKVHSGPSESHVRRDDDIAGRSIRSSSRLYEQAHSRARNWSNWER